MSLLEAIRALLARLATDTVMAGIREEEEVMGFVLALPFLGYPQGPPVDVALHVLEEKELAEILEREAFYDFADNLTFDV